MFLFGDEKKLYIVVIGVVVKDDGVFEVKAKGVASVSVSALLFCCDDVLKWMLKKKVFV